jgi:small subunit ribosomal protein S20
MANIKSQIKRNRQALDRRTRNKSTRSALKTQVKGLLASEGDDAQARYREVSKALDQAAAKGVIHKNAAARKKSRLAKRLASK